MENKFIIEMQDEIAECYSRAQAYAALEDYDRALMAQEAAAMFSRNLRAMLGIEP